MPMHDWSHVRAGVYHNFHYLWLAKIMDPLNGGLLPVAAFAMAKRRRPVGERTATFHTSIVSRPASAVERTDNKHYARKTHRLTIHHRLGKIIAVLELVSPGNKDTRASRRSFTRKAEGLLCKVVLLDPVTATASVYRPDDLQRTFYQADELTLPDVLSQSVGSSPEKKNLPQSRKGAKKEQRR